ncbi:hypothetical protein CFAM422_008379 [Trichoderma lentiforme]|uniref:Uncharacterized protein n=1 Tax=Trichoderma lentiforme TaxID=1567552 RepID=A0A9P5CA02_9HYPO|nr:hypothetical protein CFAM422_008379 [Trichoderma lentiforme]
MSSHNSATHKPGNVANSDSTPGLTSSRLQQIPEDSDHSMARFLAHSQTPTDRAPLGFRNIESEEEVRTRVKTQLDAVGAVLDPSNNPRPNQRCE